MTDTELRIATAQYPIEAPKTLLDWQDHIESWVQEGAATGAKLLVFPEYAAIEQAATCGADTAQSLEKTLDAVAELAGERVAFHTQLAKQYGVHLLVGSGPVRQNNGDITNAAQLITPTGAVGSTNKMMMTPFERDWGVVGGKELCVFDTNVGRIGIAICYDCEFPILVRALREARADLILVPSCTERVSGANRIRTSARARALENGCPIVVSPTIGDAPWSPVVDVNVGRAGIYVPAEHGISDDGILVEGDLNSRGWVVGTIDFLKLRGLEDQGEMRNAADWARQPGGDQRLPTVGVSDLR